jgi:predicted Holliday junction resolvase-like endonuclease
LTVTIDQNNWFLPAVIVAAVIWGIYMICKLIVEKHAAEQRMTDLSSAERRFDKWKEDFHATLEKTALETARAELSEWKASWAVAIRRDAISRSRAVIAGRMAENIAPYLPIFPYNPKDARFIGNPIDFIVFDGSDEGEVSEIIFLEVKARTSRLTQKQKGIREAVMQGRVSWQEMRIDENVLPSDLSDIED